MILWKIRNTRNKSDKKEDLHKFLNLNFREEIHFNKSVSFIFITNRFI